MTYCTQQDLITRYTEQKLIQLTDSDNTGQLNKAALDEAISDADSVIDGYLGSRYQLPINPVPKFVVNIACEIARYSLYDDLTPETVEKRYNAAIKSLEKIAGGKMSIGITDIGEKPTSQNTAEMVTGGSVFNRQDNSF